MQDNFCKLPLLLPVKTMLPAKIEICCTHTHTHNFSEGYVFKVPYCKPYDC